MKIPLKMTGDPVDKLDMQGQVERSKKDSCFLYALEKSCVKELTFC